MGLNLVVEMILEREKTKSALLALVLVTALALGEEARAQSTHHAQNKSNPVVAKPTAEEIAALKAKVESEPGDAKLRFSLAEALRRSGQMKEAAREYLQVTESEPTFYHAYHQIAVIASDKHIVDEALGRLNFLKDERPKDLLLRVALSELYEKKGDYFEAAKVLIDMVYNNEVPEKYSQKVSNRIRLMQAKAKDSHALDKQSHITDEQMESAPPPLPETTLNRDLSISKVKEPRVMQGFGHATLLP
ncbi:MAG: hypothetical protein K2Y32_07535 [Candidatus Obscuribacterales bacterium]|nr:hypothetical protein [Candidatus Obscuribacterales bacterium]